MKAYIFGGGMQEGARYPGEASTCVAGARTTHDDEAEAVRAGEGQNSRRPMPTLGNWSTARAHRRVNWWRQVHNALPKPWSQVVMQKYVGVLFICFTPAWAPRILQGLHRIPYHTKNARASCIHGLVPLHPFPLFLRSLPRERSFDDLVPA